MSAFPIVPSPALERELPEYLPARMVNEFAYCPRLFFYEWVEDVFQESADTIEGVIQHQRVDAKTSALPAPDRVAENIHARSVTLSSERLRVIAKMDLVESDGVAVTPVDYKHGRPREGKLGLELWPSDRAQLAVQGILLRENGYACEEGVVYYRKTGQRVRVAFDTLLIAETEALIERAWSIARQGEIPPPLEDSPKCAGCSLNSICLPDETLALSGDLAMEGTDQMALFAKVAPRRMRPAQDQSRHAVFEHAGAAGGQVRRSAPGEGEGHGGAGGSRRRDLPGEPDGQCADDDAGCAVVVRSGYTDLLFLDGRLVLRDYHGAKPEERVPAAGAIPVVGGAILREVAGAKASGGEDPQPAHYSPA